MYKSDQYLANSILRTKRPFNSNQEIDTPETIIDFKLKNSQASIVEQKIKATNEIKADDIRSKYIQLFSAAINSTDVNTMRLFLEEFCTENIVSIHQFDGTYKYLYFMLFYKKLLIYRR